MAINKYITIALACLICLVATGQNRRVFPLLDSHRFSKLPLDVTTNIAWVGYSTARRLTVTWQGAAFNVIRSSDGTSNDIGFIAGDITDTNALTTFVGPTGSGYINVLYDQSGHGQHMGNFLCSSPITNCAPLIIVDGMMQTDDQGRPALYNLNIPTRSILALVGSGPLPISSFYTFMPVTHTANHVFCQMQSSLQLSFGQVGTNRFFIDNDSGGGGRLTNGIYTVNIPYLATIYFTNAFESLQINDDAATTGTNSNNGFSNVEIGNGGGSPGTADAKMLEWIIFTNALQVVDIAILKNNINNFYTLW